MSPEDAPVVPRRSFPPPAEVPDPSAVEFDFGPDELPTDAIEILDDETVDPVAPPDDGSLEPTDRRERDPFLPDGPPAIGTPRPTPPPAERRAKAPPAGLIESTPAPIPRRPPEASPSASVPITLTAMMLVFASATLATMLAVLVPWFLLVSPSLHAQIDARVAAQAPPPPRIVEVPVPVPVAAPAAVEAAEEPEPEPEPVEAAPPPPPRPVQRAARRPEPAPEPEPEPVAAAPKPTPKAPPPAPAAPATSPAAEALSGRYAGTTGGKPVILAMTFQPQGRLEVIVQNGADAPVTVRGSYAVVGERATVAFAEPDGTSYAATVEDGSITGRLTRADGKKSRIKLRR